MAFLFEWRESMPSTATRMTDIQSPRVRNLLKAKVFEAGYPSFAYFAGRLKIHRDYLSKILNGHEFPSPNVQRKLAAELGLTLKELRELLWIKPKALNRSAVPGLRLRPGRDEQRATSNGKGKTKTVVQSMGWNVKWPQNERFDWCSVGNLAETFMLGKPTKSAWIDCDREQS